MKLEFIIFLHLLVDWLPFLQLVVLVLLWPVWKLLPSTVWAGASTSLNFLTFILLLSICLIVDVWGKWETVLIGIFPFQLFFFFVPVMNFIICFPSFEEKLAYWNHVLFTFKFSGNVTFCMKKKKGRKISKISLHYRPEKKTKNRNLTICIIQRKIVTWQRSEAWVSFENEFVRRGLRIWKFFS